jgi:HupE / UreJ protein
MKRHVKAALVALLFACGEGARAHDVEPGTLDLRETAPGTYQVLWKQPRHGDQLLPLEPVFPEGCSFRQGQGLEATPGEPGGTLTCPGGVAGATFRVKGLEAASAAVLITVHGADGRVETHRLGPGSPSATFGEAARTAAYLRIGVEVILLGVDHLLFVLGLLLIVAGRWMLLKTITSFTLAHSATLAIATLGYVRAPVQPLNAAIALSILFLGPEIVRVWRGETSFTIRHPWVVALAFGLLHGFGFASKLTAVGLPKAGIPLTLFLFNVGVEIGQLFFVLLVLAIAWSFRQLEIRWARWAEAVPGYAVGTLGAFWTIQRVALFLGLAR